MYLDTGTLEQGRGGGNEHTIGTRVAWLHDPSKRPVLTEAAKGTRYSGAHTHVSVQLVLSEYPTQLPSNWTHSLHKLTLQFVLLTPTKIDDLEIEGGTRYVPPPVSEPFG